MDEEQEDQEEITALTVPQTEPLDVKVGDIFRCLKHDRIVKTRVEKIYDNAGITFLLVSHFVNFRRIVCPMSAKEFKSRIIEGGVEKFKI